MKLTKKLSDAFNDQIGAEMWSSNLYLSMAVYFMETGLPGCANWMKKQAEEEMEHAHKLIDYSVRRGGKVVIPAIRAVPTEWEGYEQIFKKVYEHECHVSELIDNLVDIAVAEGDKATQEFLRWFVSEQVEEEESAQDILDRISAYGPNGLYAIDQELGKRN